MAAQSYWASHRDEEPPPLSLLFFLCKAVFTLLSQASLPSLSLTQRLKLGGAALGVSLVESLSSRSAPPACL